MEESRIVNIQDDWLASEIKRESRISVWDFDDKKAMVEKDHHDHCAAKLNKQALNVNQINNDVPKNKKQIAIISSMAIVIIYIVIMMIFIFM